MLLAVYIDGETKTGKGAASKAIVEALTQKYHVYYDVAGDFYRRYVALVRQYLELDEADELPRGSVLEQAAQAIYETRQAYDRTLDLGDLQRHAISKSVSVLGELPLAQQAGAEWFKLSIEKAHEAEADVIILDGRNPRRRVEDELPNLTIPVHTVLDLYMTCEPAEAARRAWLNRGITDPTDEQIAAETEHVLGRRNRDRQRADRPFISPTATVIFNPDTMTAKEAVDQSWQSHGGEALPLAITIDNTSLGMAPMLELVADLSLHAIKKTIES
ncbi:MAG: hypothetical protein JWN82_237 [Candidatus Saccharibacteria bacterium]|nr:hypothetical protein [Candidatus Saccharibacteria bacterium]